MGIPYLSENGNHFYAEGTPIVVSETSEGKILVEWVDGSIVLDANSKLSIWGGSDTEGKDPVDYDRTSVTINSGTYHNVMGGNRGPGHIKSSNVIINGGTFNAVAAGIGHSCSIAPTWKSEETGEGIFDKSNVTINDGDIYMVYGGTGSGIATVYEANLVVRGGEIDFCNAGSSNGVCKKMTGKISGGTTTIMLGGGVRGTVGDIDLEITGGTHSYVAVLADARCEFVGEAEVGLYSGTIASFVVQNQNGTETVNVDMTTMDISYAEGVINEEDVANIPEIKKDNTKGQGADMKTVRVYPFPHLSNNIFGVLVEGMPIDKVSELPMTEQEIRMCLSMGHLFEVIGDKLIVLDEHNYNQDNSDAPEFAGDLPCDDCEIIYPRAEEKVEEVATQAIRKVRRSSSKKSVAAPDCEDAVVVEDSKKEESSKAE